MFRFTLFSCEHIDNPIERWQGLLIRLGQLSFERLKFLPKSGDLLRGFRTVVRPRGIVLVRDDGVAEGCGILNALAFSPIQKRFGADGLLKSFGALCAACKVEVAFELRYKF